MVRDARALIAPDAARRQALVRDALDHAFASWSRGELDAALASCRDALRIDPTNVDALSHTGTILWTRGDVHAAASFYRRAHAIAPAHPGVLLNLAAVADADGDLAASAEWIERAAAAAPNHPEVVWRRALVELAMGDYVDGFRHYEAGLLQPSMRGPGPGFVTPPWNGERCERLVLWHEQGLGDTIQFVRYAKLCRARAARVVVLCPPELTTLLRSCPYLDDAVDSIGADEFDAHASLLSLPHLFGTTLETVPADVPYLFVDTARRERWRIDATTGDRLAVGLVWSGNFRVDQPRFHAVDRRRNLSFDAMAPLLSIPGIEFHSLQRGPAASEIRDRGLVDHMDRVHDLADTAALIDRLDLVISVDTSVAHLAGALGKPVWILSRLDACWRWLRNQPRSPWYPTARVFGQTKRGDWSDPIDRVHDALIDLANERGR